MATFVGAIGTPGGSGAGGLDREVRVELAGFLAELSEVELRALRLTPVFRGAVDRLVTEFLERRFASEGAYLGTRWQPLAERTKRQRARPGRGRGGILWDLGDLRASLVKSGGPNSIRQITDSLYRRGTTDPKAQIHQYGATITRRRRVKDAGIITRQRARRGRLGAALGARYTVTIPARPIFPEPLPPALVDAIAAAIRAYLAKGGA